MRLHDFIAAHREVILEEWVVFARSCMPAARDMDIGTLRDHASEMIDAVIADLQTRQTAEQQRLKSLGTRDAPSTLHDDAEGGSAAQSHGAGRARSGFTIEQMVSEYRALRASVLRLWLLDARAVNSDEIEDLMRFNEAIDQALAESVASFARVVGTVLREARAQLEKRVEDRTRQLAQINDELLSQIRQRERAEDARIRLLQQVVKAQEDEQRRIARELHDQMGQQITALGLKVSALRGNHALHPPCSTSSKISRRWCNSSTTTSTLSYGNCDLLRWTTWALSMPSATTYASGHGISVLLPSSTRQAWRESAYLRRSKRSCTG